MARKCDCDDLKIRGIAARAEASNNLEIVTEPGDGMLLKCDRLEGELCIRVVCEGYELDFHVQFPRLKSLFSSRHFHHYLY